MVREDLARVAEIYNAGIAERIATFETRPRTEAEISSWTEGSLPAIVADEAGAVIGWARVQPYSDREAYAGIGRHTVYVDPAVRGRGLGRRLLADLVERAAAAGLHKLTSLVLADNGASRATHAAVGFREVGVHERHAVLDGRWRDVIVVEKLL